MKTKRSSGLHALPAAALGVWLLVGTSAPGDPPPPLADHAPGAAVRLAAATPEHPGPPPPASCSAGPREIETGATTLMERETMLANTPGHVMHRRLLKTDFKYPLLRVEDEYELQQGERRRLRRLVSVGDHVVVKPRPGITEEVLLDGLKGFGASVRKRLPAAGVWLVSFPNANLDTVPAAITEIARIGTLASYAEPDYLLSANGVPDDTEFAKLWGMHNTGQSGGTADADIDAPEAWDLHPGSAVVKVGVLDTGVDYTHPDLAANIWVNPGEIPDNGVDDDGNGFVDDVRGWDFVNGDSDPMDDNAHGSHCAGTIGAVGNNGIGVAGVCWQVSIMPLKIINAAGSGSTSDAAEAVSYATANGAMATSNSWDIEGYSQTLKDAIDDAGAAGVLFVTAAGNQGLDNDTRSYYPANFACPNLIAVASTTRQDGLSWFSNHGRTKVHLGAPGSDIYSTAPGNSYAMSSGTSMAAPHVAGACALVKSFNPGLSHSDIRSIVLSSTEPLAALAGKTVSGGRLNIHQALLSAADLGISPDTPVSARGPVGGPFSPPVATYTIINHGASPAAWSVSGEPAWATLSQSAGVLAAGAATTLDLTINAAADTLAAGSHHGTLIFHNPTTGSNQTRAVTLRVGLPDSFTEWFDSSFNDTANQQFTFTPDGSPGFYDARRDGAAVFPTDPTGGTALALEDDDSVSIALTGGRQVLLYGVGYGSFHVSSNGYVFFGSGEGLTGDPLTAHFSQPRIAALFDDLDPGAGGTVSWQQLADRVAVTYHNIVEAGTPNPNSFQIELFFDGRIRLTLLQLAAADGLIGLSQGLGTPPDFAESDFTRYPPTLPLLPGPELTVELPDGTGLTSGAAVVDFGNVAVGASGDLILVARNAGLEPLTGISASIDGVDAGEFTVAGAPPTALAAGAAATFTVRFSPTAPGVRRAGLHLASNDPDGNPFDLDLTGTALLLAPQEIAVEQAAGIDVPDGGKVDFGAVLVPVWGTSRSLALTIRNTGAQDLAGLAITKDGTNPGEFTVSGPLPTILPGGGNATVTVTFTPSQYGSRTRTAAFHIPSNDTDENPFDIELAGVVTPVPDIAVEQPAGTDLTDGSAAIDFGHIAVGGSSSPFTFTVRNSGVKSLNNLVLTKSGWNAADFTLNGPGTTSMAVGGGTTFTATFTPAAPGPRTATIHLASDDPDENPFDIDVRGGSGTDLEFWRMKYFGSPANGGAGADLNDFDHDGIPNLLEFAFGLPPKHNSPGGLPQPRIIDGNAVITFSQPEHVSGITYAAEWSQTLLPGSWTAIPDTGTPPQRTFSVPIAAKAQLYLRLKVTNP